MLYLVCLFEGCLKWIPMYGKGITEVYAKIFYTSCRINFLATYSEIKVFSDSFKFKDT